MSMEHRLNDIEMGNAKF